MHQIKDSTPQEDSQVQHQDSYNTHFHHQQLYLQLVQSQHQTHAELINSNQTQEPSNKITEDAKPRGRMGMKSVGGEIVQVQGGHIVRSTGRKDRHSKVYTAKGPRDRRVRLSAHTAIQFYDVQDRLGYDRPSKAVDWLIKKAKTAIAKLAELPPWHPTGVTPNATEGEAPNGAGTSEMVISAEQSESSGYNFQLQGQIGDNTDHKHNDSNFIPQSLDSDTIADTMKSFFPTSSAASTINFQSYPSDIISRTTNLSPNQDLGLSLHSFQDQGLIHHTQQSHQDTTHHHNDQIQTIFAVPATAGFDPSTYERMVAWSSNSSSHENNNRGLFFNNMSALPHQQQQALMGQQQHSSAFVQRGTLQSSFTPSIRSWSDEIQIASQRTQQPIHHSSIFGTRFSSDGLPVFRIPTTRIHGDDADNAVVSDRPTSTSSPNPNHH